MLAKIMDRLALLKTFAATLEAGSFTGAAERLGSNPKLVSKHVASLEAAFGLRLFSRTTRTLSVTEAGRRLYDGTVDLLARYDDLEAAVRADVTLVAGRIRVSAPLTYGEVVLLPLVRRFLVEHPNVEIDLRLSDRFVDLTDEGFDMALRIGGSAISNLVGRKLRSTSMMLIASPELLSRYGTPSNIEELEQFPLIGDSNLRAGQFWPLIVDGGERQMPVRARLTVNSARAAVQCTMCGDGISLSPDYIVDEMIADGRVVRVLDKVSGPTFALRAVFQDGRRMPLRVRRFIDFLNLAMRQPVDQ